MKTRNVLFTLAFVFASIIMLPAARADDHDQASKLTFNQSVQIPGRVLPAGTYWFVLADSNSNRNIVQIFNFDRSAVLATFFTIDTESLKTDYTAITFADRGAMQSETIVSWSYPTGDYGHQFVYSKPEEQELARATHQTITAG